MNLLSLYSTKEKWETIRTSPVYKKHREELEFLYNTYCKDKDMASLPYSQYREFYRSGDRDGYERYYFNRRQALNACTFLSLIYPENEEYFTRLQDEIFAICDEYSWCLPAHQSNWEEVDDSFLDLFASETGYALSSIYCLLGDRLDPLVQKRLLSTVRHRVVDSFLSRTFHWENATHNWAAVCGGSIACTFMLLFPEEYPKIHDRIAHTMERFLSGFTKEGFCLEGTNYWSYGFGFFLPFADLLNRFTNGKENYFKREDVHQIALFLQKMFLSGSACVAFADSSRTLKYPLGIMHFLKHQYRDILAYDPSLSYNYDHCARFIIHLTSLIWCDDDLYNHPDESPKDYTVFAEQAQWFIKRNKHYGFCAKGGYNEEPHNNNDVGTFILVTNGTPKLVDLGAGEYTRQYFTASERYTFLETMSTGHNVPFFGDAIQHNGPTYRASYCEADDSHFTVEFKDAYEGTSLDKLQRTFTLQDHSISLVDEITYKENDPITERFISLIEPQLKGDEVVIEDVTLISLDGIQARITKTSSQKHPSVYLIDFVYPHDTYKTSFSISIE